MQTLTFGDFQMFPIRKVFHSPQAVGGIVDVVVIAIVVAMVIATAITTAAAIAIAVVIRPAIVTAIAMQMGQTDSSWQ